MSTRDILTNLKKKILFITLIFPYLLGTYSNKEFFRMRGKFVKSHTVLNMNNYYRKTIEGVDVLFFLLYIINCFKIRNPTQVILLSYTMLNYITHDTKTTIAFEKKLKKFKKNFS